MAETKTEQETMVVPADRDDLKLVDTIILNGKVALIDYRVWGDETDQLVGVQHLSFIPTFRGEKVTVTDEFAFSPEMEERLGWYDIWADLRYAFSDSPIDPHTVAEDAILSYYGLVDRDYVVSWSETSGYLWTEEKFKVGGHSILDILKDNLGRYVHMEIDIYQKKSTR